MTTGNLCPAIAFYRLIFFRMYKYALTALVLLIQPVDVIGRPDLQDPAPVDSFDKNLAADSVEQLEEVTVSGYISGQPLLVTPTSVGIVTGAQLRQLADQTFLPAVNAVPGVRMEERSPGSYRLSIRGSLLRSPWGVRNVKVYLDEFPLTDAGGNTYLNLVDPGGAGRLEILKGPHGSLFGANSGGVLLINTSQASASARSPGMAGDGAGWRPDLLRAEISGGSYGLFQENLNFSQRGGRSYFDLNQAFLRSDGYREHSRMNRHYVQAAHRWNYKPTNQFKILAVYADMDYATPGGLNREQFEADPRQARPPAGPNPGAVEQQAGIQNRTFFGGLSHQAQMTPDLRHVLAVFGSHTDFENPFITNYEIRDESNYGVRSFLEYDLPNWKWHLGLEWQSSHHDISNFDNLGDAVRGDLQAADLIRTRQYFYFTRFSGNMTPRLRMEATVSLNYYRYVFEEQAGDMGAGKRKFSPQWMPRVGLSYLVKPNLSWRASVSRGFSPPTTAEIRPSNIVINTNLDPETGWNYETGLRFGSREGRFQADAAVFFYRMDNAIVRRLEAGGEEFFTNAGGTDQLGVESEIRTWVILPRSTGFLRGFQLRNSYTYSHFHFRDYQQGDDDHSGNQLTGVPQHVLVNGLTLHFPFAVSLTAQHNFTSRIPLDDANSTYADAYHLVQLKLNWQKEIGGGRTLALFGGVDNLLNERYSLGNDINAFGGRYYNAAPLQNFYGGIRMSF